MFTVDREELAWCAGFFDGEGSTMAVGRLEQPRGTRVVLSIGQSAPEGMTPEVLLRFERAMGGLLRLNGPYPHGTGLPHWALRTMRWENVQAVVALMWPFLGAVKRAQAAHALRAYKSFPRQVSGRPRGNTWDQHPNCPNGHPWNEKNTRIYVKPVTGYVIRFCRACANDRYHATKKLKGPGYKRRR